MLSKNKILLIAGMSFISLANADRIRAKAIHLNPSAGAKDKGDAFMKAYSGDNQHSYNGFTATVTHYDEACVRDQQQISREDTRQTVGDHGMYVFFRSNEDLPDGCVIKLKSPSKIYGCNNKACIEDDVDNSQ